VKKVFSTVLLTSLIASMLMLGFLVQPVRTSGTIYIRADGSVEGTDKISTMNNITYTFTDNIYDSIVVERDNILLDGQGYLLQGTGSGNGITLSGRSNVTLRNIKINQFNIGIWLNSSSNCNTVSGNRITSNGYTGVYLWFSYYNTVSGNNIISNHWEGVSLYSSINNTVSGNSITNSLEGIYLSSSINNTVSGNSITNSLEGIYLSSSINNTVSGNSITNSLEGLEGIHLYSSSNYNTISGNIITNSVYGISLLASSNYNKVSGNSVTSNDYGVWLSSSINNTIYHNNFINNPQVTISGSASNIWDNGCEGNFWSDYNGTDSDGDGIGDTPYIIDGNITDNYPLMNPYWNPADINHDLKVDIFDVVSACSAYKSTPVDMNWNCHCDIADPTGIINIFDIVLICSSYGEEY